jgi:pyridoxal biosynthesis lyase PdxS
MNTEKLKEEIRLLERKLELLEQINKIQTFPVYPYPNGGVTTSPCPAPCGTTAFPNGSISAYNGSAITDRTIGRK